MTKKNNFKKQYSNVAAKQNKNPMKITKSVTGIKGLSNLGNTCYFNSMLQMFLHCPFFLQQLKDHCFSDQIIIARLETEEYKLVQQTIDTSVVEKELVFIWESETQNVSPSNLLSALLQHKDFKAHFSGFNEQDSHEVFLMVLNIMKEAQIKRMRASILDHFNCRRNQTSVDDNAKKKIKDISTVVEKQNLINKFFGIVIGSTFKCKNCGELRMRFDEVFHISPVFPEKRDIFDDDDIVVSNKSEPDPVILKSFNQVSQPEKLSKHQLKRQKRMEKKLTRNKKSVHRNLLTSPEDIGKCDSIKSNTEVEYEENVNIVVDVLKEPDENVEYPAMFGGYNGENVDIKLNENIEESFVMQKLIYDAVTLNSELHKDNKSIYSNDSMIVRKNDSSRTSLASLSSQSDIDILAENGLCQEFNQNFSLQDKYLGIDSTKDEKNVMSADISLEGNDIVNISTDPISLEKEKYPISDIMSYNENSVILEELNDPNDIVIIQSSNGDKNKESLNTLYSSIIETHQDHFCSINLPKVVFETETDLDKALKKFNMPMLLENIVCESCSKSDVKIKTDHFKTDIICHLPQILPFYISRFKQTAARNRTKNTTVYSYPFILNLSSQCSKYVNISGNTNPVLYRIIGIIEHIGVRINTGHYVSYVSRRIKDSDNPKTCQYSTTYPVNILAELRRKHEENAYKFDNLEWLVDENQRLSENEEPSEYQWFRISDSHVEQVTTQSMMNIQAFMLFYSRVQ